MPGPADAFSQKPPKIPKIPAESRVVITGISSIHGWPVYEKMKSLLGSERIFGIRPPRQSAPDDANTVSLCMTDASGLRRLREDFRPTHVLHAAGVCDLDVCESRPDYAYDINVLGARNVADTFSSSCYIMYLSSDLVFSGNRIDPGGYSEIDIPDPVSVVGKTYALAEKEISLAPRHAIVRLGLPMGNSIHRDKGAVNFIEQRLRRGLPTSLFHDEYRSCINCADLADCVARLLPLEPDGVIHMGGPKAYSLYEIGERLLLKGGYRREALIRRSRLEDVTGPPRIGDVRMNSAKAERILGRRLQPWIC